MSRRSVVIISAFLLIACVGVGNLLYARYASYRSVDNDKNTISLLKALKASSDTQHNSPEKVAVTATGNQYSVATGTPIVEAQNWLSFSKVRPFEIEFKYPGPPIVLAQHALTSTAGYLQIAFPTQFVVTIDVSPMDWSLDRWLYEPPQPGDHSNYQSVMKDIRSNRGMYLASTTIDGTTAIELGFDCSKVDASSGMPRFSEAERGWEYGYYSQIVTVRNGLFYRFTAHDICKYRQGSKVFREILSTVKFGK
jgi:hypothetical protein